MPPHAFMPFVFEMTASTKNYQNNLFPKITALLLVAGQKNKVVDKNCPHQLLIRRNISRSINNGYIILINFN